MSRLPPRVFVVVDDIDHVVLIRRMLADVAPDLPVETITDAYDLLARLVEAVSPGALLLIDRLLDGREVYETLAHLCAARPDVTVVMLSAALGDEERRRALAAGARRAEQKPGSLAGWRALLGELVGAAPAAQSRDDDGRGAVA